MTRSEFIHQVALNVMVNNSLTASKHTTEYLNKLAEIVNAAAPFDEEKEPETLAQKIENVMPLILNLYDTLITGPEFKTPDTLPPTEEETPPKFDKGQFGVFYNNDKKTVFDLDRYNFFDEARQKHISWGLREWDFYIPINGNFIHSEIFQLIREVKP